MNATSHDPRALDLAACILCAPAAAAALRERGRAAPTASRIRSSASSSSRRSSAGACFEDKFEEQVWLAAMEPKLKKLRQGRERARRHPAPRALRSTSPAAAARAGHGGHRRREPLRSLGRVVAPARSGLMQVMPFWPRQLGMTNHELVRIPQNVRMGCTILKFYLDRERATTRGARALQRQRRPPQLLRSGARPPRAIAGSTSRAAHRACRSRTGSSPSSPSATSLHLDCGHMRRGRAARASRSAPARPRARRRPALRRARQADCARSRDSRARAPSGASRRDRKRPARARNT